MKLKGLTSKFILLFGVLQLIFILLGGLIISKLISDQIVKERTLRIEHTARILAFSLAPHLSVHDITSIQSVVDATFNTSERGEILAIEIRDEGGRVIVSRSLGLQQGVQATYMREPVKLDKLMLGEVSIVYSSSWIIGYTRNLALTPTLFVTLFSTTAAIIILYFTLSTIVKPLRVLSNKSESLKDGVFNVEDLGDRRDEIGEVAHRLEEAARIVELKEKELLDSYERLKKWCQEAQTNRGEVAAVETIKENFINMAAHELRTPLTIVKGNIEILREGKRFELSEEVRGKLDVILKRIDYLIGFVNDLTDLTLIGKESLYTYLHKHRISIGEIAEEVVDEFRHIAAQKRLTLRNLAPDDLPLVNGDPLRLRQVFSNLIDNAIKFSTPGGEVKITILKEESNNNIITVITNRGQPISPTELTRIFTPFYRAQEADGTKGLGLGLSIARGVVEGHGGEIWAEGDPDGLTRFSFSLPLAPVPEKAL